MKKHINEYIYSYGEDAWIQDEFFNDVVNNQKELPGEFAKLVHDNFWDLVNVPKKKKATGVLGEMIANMNQESLQKTRKEMIAEVEQQIKKCIGMILTDADEQRFKDFDVTLKECLEWLEKQGTQTPTEIDVCTAVRDILKIVG